MRYGSIKKVNRKTLRVPVFDDGVTFTELKSSIKDNALSDCSNIWLSNGRIKTRPGFTSKESSVFVPPLKEYQDEYNYEFTSCNVEIEGKTYKVAISDICIDDSVVFYNVYFIDENGEITPKGEINLSRVSSDIFYRVKSVLVYQGKKQNGCGIYMLITQENQYNEKEVFYSLRELDETYSNWRVVTTFYTPTVYINGRGNKYSIARNENNFNLPSPEKIESLNLLNGEFNAYYTSDGFSNSFRLPFTDLSQKRIKCRIYYTLVDFVEWEIKENIISDTKQFFGKEVTITADREKGNIFFTTTDGDYAIPVMDMYNENNIKITAVKEIKNQNKKLSNAKNIAYSEGRTFITFGESSNEIISILNENPLYFPSDSTVKIGDDSKEITAIAVKEEKLLTFFKDETHIVTFKKGEQINSTALLMDTDRTFFENDSFSSVCISKEIGCKNPKTLCFYNEKAVWLTNTNEIFAINSLKAKKIYKISEKIDLLLSKFNKYEFFDSFAVYGLGHYILKIGTKALVLKLEENAQKWFVWDLPKNVILGSASSFNLQPFFICKGSDRNVNFVAMLSSNNDSDVFYKDEELTVSNTPINCSLTTKEFNFASLQNKKNIEAIYFTIAAKQRVQIAVNGKVFADIDFGFSDEDYNKGVYKSVKLLHNFHGVENIYITISSDNNLSVGEMEISYTL